MTTVMGVTRNGVGWTKTAEYKEQLLAIERNHVLGSSNPSKQALGEKHHNSE